jgi:hypothetical protein
VHLYGEPAEHTFREAGVKFLAENLHKRTIERDVRTLKVLDPFIGSLPLKQVHLSGTSQRAEIRPFVRQVVVGSIDRDYTRKKAQTIGGTDCWLSC